MGEIADLRDDISAGIKLTMRYEQGGKVQVYAIGDAEIRVGPDASHAEIKDGLAREMAKKKNPTADIPTPAPEVPASNA
jgi:hypothetical protein